MNKCIFSFSIFLSITTLYCHGQIDSLFNIIEERYCYTNYDSSMILLDRIDSINNENSLEIKYDIYAWQEHCASYWNKYGKALEAIRAIHNLPIDSISSLQNNDEVTWIRMREGNLLYELGALTSAYNIFDSLAISINLESINNASAAQNYRIIILYLAGIEKKRKNYQKAEALYKYIIEIEKKIAKSQNRRPVIETNYGRLADVQRLLGMGQECLKNSLIALERYQTLRRNNPVDSDFYLKDVIRIMYQVYDCAKMNGVTNHDYLLQELMVHMDNGVSGIHKAMPLIFRELIRTKGIDRATSIIDEYLNEHSIMTPHSYIELNNTIGNELLGQEQYCIAYERFNNSISILDSLGDSHANNDETLYNRLGALSGILHSEYYLGEKEFASHAHEAMTLFEKYKSSYLFDEEGMLKIEEFDHLYEIYLESICKEEPDINEVLRIIENRSKNTLYRQILLGDERVTQNENYTNYLLLKRKIKDFVNRNSDSLTEREFLEMEKALFNTVNESFQPTITMDYSQESSYKKGVNYLYYFYTQTSFNCVHIDKSGGRTLYNLGNTKYFKSLFLSLDFTSVDNAENSFLAKMHLLYQKLIAPLHLNGVRQLIIMPIPDVGFLPFGSFIREQNNPFSFLEKEYSISYQNSIYSYNSIVNRQYSEDRMTFIKPHIPKSQVYTLNSNYAENDTIMLDLLKYAFLESEEIKNTIGGEIITPSKQKVVSALESSRIFHFSGHVFSHSNDYNDILLVLSNNLHVDSSKLRLHDIYNINCRNEMVVLSACNTANGQIAKGEGVLSLARAFLYAGAKSVISTLWSINDQSSAFIMTEFYKELKKGKRKDEALRQAKLTYLDQADPEYQHPYYWAAFIAMGDMSPLFFPYRKYKIGGVAICSILILGFAFRKNQQLNAAA